MDPNDRVKIKDGVVLFEPEKERFVSTKNEPQYYTYYNLHPENDVIKEGDYYSITTDEWQLVVNPNCFGVHPIDTYDGSIIFKYRRKIQKNPTS